MLYVAEGLKRIDLVLGSLKSVICNYHYHRPHYTFIVQNCFTLHR